VYVERNLTDPNVKARTWNLSEEQRWTAIDTIVDVNQQGNVGFKPAENAFLEKSEYKFSMADMLKALDALRGPLSIVVADGPLDPHLLLEDRKGHVVILSGIDSRGSWTVPIDKLISN
ncbi:MAG: hypothetical protein ACRDF4_10950, partial [Rhabdochlamydiaceae bacterium]